MQAGRPLDFLIEQHVFKREVDKEGKSVIDGVHRYVPHYSTNPGDSQLVIDAMEEMGEAIWERFTEQLPSYQMSEVLHKFQPIPLIQDKCEDICVAALVALGHWKRVP